jgi:hypothetical protein
VSSMWSPSPILLVGPPVDITALATQQRSVHHWAELLLELAPLHLVSVVFSVSLVGVAAAPTTLTPSSQLIPPAQIRTLALTHSARPTQMSPN